MRREDVRRSNSCPLHAHKDKIARSNTKTDTERAILFGISSVKIRNRDEHSLQSQIFYNPRSTAAIRARFTSVQERRYSQIFLILSANIVFSALSAF